MTAMLPPAPPENRRRWAAGDEAWPVLAGHELEGVARILGAEDADQPALDALFADELLGPAVFAERASAIEVSTASLRGEALGVFDEAVAIARGPVLRKGLRHTLTT